MKTLEKLKADLKTAMLNKDEARKSIIRLLISEINYAEKLPTTKDLEGESIKILIKMRKNAEEMNEPGEIAIISEYLPKTLTDFELEHIIETLIVDNGYSTIKDMGKIISTLKELYNGQFDGKTASDLIKKHLN